MCLVDADGSFRSHPNQLSPGVFRVTEQYLQQIKPVPVSEDKPHGLIKIAAQFKFRIHQ